MSKLPDDARQVFLFLNSEEGLFAITRNKNGANLPLISGDWKFEKEMTLGVQEPLEAGIDPEPVIRGLRADGYFIWPVKNIEPFGTGQ
jgi:hypothetical protein